jgi:hypothetical protein
MRLRLKDFGSRMQGDSGKISDGFAVFIGLALCIVIGLLIASSGVLGK